MEFKTASIHTTYQVDGESALSGVEFVSFQDEYKKNLHIPPGGVLYGLQIELAITVGFVLIACGKSMRIKINDWTADMENGQAIVWTKQSGKPCPLKADTKIIGIESAEDGIEGTLLIRVMENNKPNKPVEASPVNELPTTVTMLCNGDPPIVRDENGNPLDVPICITTPTVDAA